MPNYIRQLRKSTTGLPPVAGIPSGVLLINTADATLSFPNAAGTDWITIAGAGATPSFALNQETFTGNGAQTVFSTTSTDSTDSHFIVAIGGVFQTAGTDYTVANGQITFNQAPPNGEAINVLIASGGIAGPQGPAGPTGAAGAAGANGADGADGADALWNYRGAYDVGSAYAVGDVATHNGSLWYRKDANGGNVGDTPATGSSFWDLLASKGDTGAAGTNGTNGTNGTSFVFVGVYNSGTVYTVGQVVRYEDTTAQTIGCYVRKSTSGSELPTDSSKWDAMLVMPTTGGGGTPTASFYKRPDGGDYLRPNGIDTYQRPAA